MKDFKSYKNKLTLYIWNYIKSAGMKTNLCDFKALGFDNSLETISKKIY